MKNTCDKCKWSSIYEYTGYLMDKNSEWMIYCHYYPKVEEFVNIALTKDKAKDITHYCSKFEKKD